MPASSVTAIMQDWMSELGDRERTALTTRTHLAAETSQDLDRICSSIANNSFFVVPTKTATGYRLDDDSVLTSDEDVRAYYANRMDGYLIEASRQIRTSVTPWYTINETVATVFGTGPVDDIDTTG